MTIVLGNTFDVESIICNSQLVTELDSCSLPDTSERLFAIVFGFEDSDYAIRVGNGSTIVSPIDNGTIADDDPFANADAASTGGSAGGSALGILGLLALAGAGLGRKTNRR